MARRLYDQHVFGLMEWEWRLNGIRVLNFELDDATARTTFQFFKLIPKQIHTLA
jgi:hypothetical protein